MFGLIQEKNAISYSIEEMKTITELENYIGDWNTPIERGSITIHVLDDEGFDSDPLKRLGYTKIIVHNSFISVDSFHEADIILCDVDGVGVGIDATQQGIAIANQLKKSYPEKLVAIYTSKNVEEYGGQPHKVDALIRKSSTMSDLAFELDQLWGDAKNPLKIWKKTEDYMRNRGVSNKYIAFTEHYYCKTIIEKENYFNRDEIKSVISTEKLESYVNTIVRILPIVLEIISKRT